MILVYISIINLKLYLNLKTLLYIKIYLFIYLNRFKSVFMGDITVSVLRISPPSPQGA